MLEQLKKLKFKKLKIDSRTTYYSDWFAIGNANLNSKFEVRIKLFGKIYHLC